MHKRVINLDQKNTVHPDQKWLDIEKLAVVEVSSEIQSFQSSPHSSRIKPRAGAHQTQENRLLGLFSTHLENSNGSA